MVRRARETEQKAAQWLARRDNDHWSPRDQIELDEWLAESTANVVAYVRLESAWTRADRLQALGAGFAPGKIPTADDLTRSPFFAGDSKEPSADHDRVVEMSDETGFQMVERCDEADHADARARKLRQVRRALAAGVALAVIGAAAWFNWFTAPDYKTPIGGTASVPMADGSSVTLNTDSAIRVVVTPKERDVTLDQGEAFFEVAHDPSRPFVVRAGNKRITAVGTKFSVRRYGDDVRVFVTEGKVRLEAGGGYSLAFSNWKSAAAAATPLYGRNSALPLKTAAGEVYLAAGGIARTDGDGVLVQERPIAEVEESLSWRTGYIVFHESTLADAAAELNRYSARKIIIEDPNIAGIRLSGKFRTNDFEAFVRLITSGFPIHVRQAGDRIVLTKDPRAHW